MHSLNVISRLDGHARGFCLVLLAAFCYGLQPLFAQYAYAGGADPVGLLLARFTLALKVVVARSGPPPTLIFDEVDSAIGGATAAAVGERLAILAQKLQVLVVTHSPQVAARAQHHWRVAKASARGATTTSVEILDARERREEIARMLSGAKITDAARAAADSLLADRGAKTTATKPTRKRA